jgi:hypothetical protein
MPRVKLGPSTNELLKVIRSYANENERGIEDALGGTKLTVSKYYRRLKAPEEFTVEELRQVSRAFHIPWEELQGALERAIRV